MDWDIFKIIMINKIITNDLLVDNNNQDTIRDIFMDLLDKDIDYIIQLFILLEGFKNDKKIKKTIDKLN